MSADAAVIPLGPRQLTVSRRRQAIAIYRARSLEALLRAKQARMAGDLLEAAGYLDEAETWLRLADAWVSKPEEGC